MINEIWLKEENYYHLINEALKWEPKETGGIITGYCNNNKTIVITEIVGPGPNAIHKKDSFVPDYKFHDDNLAIIYEKSGRTEVYLGDWHTHPNSIAYLSKRDKKTLKNISEYKPARIKEPLMIVIGTNPLILKIWSYNNGFNEIDDSKIVLYK